MDCPSEEALISMKLEGLSMIKSLVFDIENRKLFVFHSEKNSEIKERLKELNMGAEHIETVVAQQNELTNDTSGTVKITLDSIDYQFCILYYRNDNRFIFLINGFSCRFT